MKLQQENIVLQRENVRLLREVNDIKRDYAYLERQLTRASYKIYNLRTQLHSTTSLGQVILVIGVLVTVFLLLFYGMEFVIFSMPSLVEDNVPVIERLQY